MTHTTSRTSFRIETLATLSRHGLLTTRQLHTLAARPNANIGWCRKVLAGAAADGLLKHVHLSRSREKSWYLTPTGFDAIAGINTNPLKMTEAIATGPTAAHLGVVNTFGIGATETLGPDAEVTWRHEEPLPLGSGRYLRPDAVLSVLTQQGAELVGGEWFIEADRGTEAIGILVAKLANYLTYRNYRPSHPGERTQAELHWRTRFRSWPQILFVFDCPRAETRIQRLAAWAGSDPRLKLHWNKIGVTAIALDNVAHLGTTNPLIAIPTLERHQWIGSAGLQTSS